ncbi:unnamed protein product [Trichobilharzia regenti]|nr:unnamed protein product [Trichobilharzia regenti]
MPMDMVTVGEFSNNKAYYPFPLWLEHHIHVPGSVKHLFSGSSSSISQPVPQMWRTYEPGGIANKLLHNLEICKIAMMTKKNQMTQKSYVRFKQLIQ